MTKQESEPMANAGYREAMERIAVAIEAEVARRKVEADEKAAESRRVRLATVLLIYLAPLLFVLTTIGNSQAVQAWISDPVKLGVVAAISIAIITATLQAVRLDVRGLSVLSFLVLLFMMTSAQMAVESGREEIDLVAVLYLWPGLWLMYLYAQTTDGAKPLLESARKSFVGPTSVAVFWSVPVLGFVVPYGIFRLTQSWTLGN